jgi:hypothetical protein
MLHLSLEEKIIINNDTISFLEQKWINKQLKIINDDTLNKKGHCF